MSDEHETPAVPDPGAAIEDGETSDTAVQDAVERATAISSDGTVEPMDHVSAAYGDGTSATTAAESSGPSGTDSPEADAAAEQAYREEAALVDTQLNLDAPAQNEGNVLEARDGQPSVRNNYVAEVAAGAAAGAAAGSLSTPATETPARDGEIRISADHPMAALYMQSPMPPDLKGNRGAGTFIALLATVAFAVLYAGIIALWIAPKFPPSTFLNDGLLPWVTSWGFIAGVVAFFIGLLILVLIFGRAGWWAYVVFSLFVGVLVWLASAGTFAITGTPLASLSELVQQYGATGSQIEKAITLMKHLGFTVPTLGAAVLAREVAVWFGAWIGARGRKVSAKNAALLKEYEAALAEVRAQQ